MKKITFLLWLLLGSLNLSAQIDSTLMHYIRLNDTAKVDSLITAGVDIHATDEHGANALMWACHDADSAMVALLYESGAKLPSSDMKKMKSRIFDYQAIKKEFLDLHKAAEYNDATELSNKLLELSKDIFGEKHLFYANDMNIAAVSFQEKGDFERALFYSESGITIIEQSGEVRHSIYCESLMGLAGVYEKQGKYKEAVLLADQAVSILEEIEGRDNNFFLRTLNALGYLYKKNGELEKALPIYIKTFELSKQIFGKNSENYFYSAINLAGFYRAVSAYDDAIYHANEALYSAEKVYGKNHPSYGVALNSLGASYYKKENYDKAISLYLESLKIIKNVLGEKHIQYGIKLNNLAVAYKKQGKYEEALVFYKKVLENFEMNLGKSHPNYGHVLGNLTYLYKAKKDYENALSSCLESIEINKKRLGKTHYEYGMNLNTMLGLYETINATEETAVVYSKLINNRIFNLENRFFFAPEKIQYQWQQEYLFLQNKLNSFYNTQTNVEIPDSLVIYNIFQKSLVASNRLQYFDSEGNTQYLNWLSLKNEIGQELAKPIAKRTTSLDSLRNEADKIETLLLAENKQFRNQNQEITIERLKAKLQPNESILDIVHFDYYDIDRKTDTVLYIGYLVTPDTEQIKSITICNEKELEKVLENTASNNRKIDKLYASRGLTPNRKDELKDLTFIWEALLPELESYKKLHISPSGLLNKLNLGAIAINQDSLAADRFEIVQYNNLRSMLAEYDERPNNDFVLVGGIDYDYTSDTTLINGDTIDTYTITNPATYTDDAIRGLRSEIGEKWNYLAGTKKEVTILSNKLKEQDISHTTLTGKAASETVLKAQLSQATSPRVVHISTHGFFYPDVDNDNETSAFKASDNPMIRSGLILAEANHAWQTGETPPDREDDGILTAYEVANLNLTDTDLVVLSACETGLGDINGSEGVMGLQRALKIAGARYVMMSLWQVPDEATQRLMTAFYTNWLEEDMNIRTAFNAAQQSLQADYDSPYFWAGFVLIE